MILPAAVIASRALGSLAGSPVVSSALSALLILATMRWLLRSLLRGALAAEWDAALGR